MSVWYCCVNGRQYGPMDVEQLRQWARSGTLKPTDLVWTEGMAEWARADAVPGQFQFAPAPPAVVPPALIPHRGATVLIMGILGLVCCFIFGIIGWAMGSSDLRDMNAGRMDPSGRGLTQAGKICGIISVILAIISIVITLIAMACGDGHHYYFHHRAFTF